MMAATCGDKPSGGNVTTRTYADDDFPMIRSRMVELRREREHALADQKGRSPVGPKPYHRATTSDTDHQDDRLLPRSFRKFVR
jgi:hypothetical protein